MRLVNAVLVVLLCASCCMNYRTVVFQTHTDDTVTVVSKTRPYVVYIEAEHKPKPEEGGEDAKMKLPLAGYGGCTYSGTGTVIDNYRGLVLTAYHVVVGADELRIYTVGDRICKAKLVTFDADRDLAVLKIPSMYIASKVPIGKSRTLRVGESVIAIGHGLGLKYTVTKGIVSGLHKKSDEYKQDEVHTDAIANPGNSGGPLINMKGEIVGVVVATYMRGYGYTSGITVAVPIDNAADLIAEARRAK